jgi:hypothetical protein
MLEQLDVLGSYYVSEEAIEKFVYLKIKNCFCLIYNGFVFLRIFLNCKSLKFFDMSFCTNITKDSTKVQDFARRYPKCTIKSSYQE